MSNSDNKKAKVSNVVVRNAQRQNIPGILEVAKAAYAQWTSRQLANEHNYKMQINAFPEGQFVAVDGDKVVGYCTSLVVNIDDDSPWYAHGEITGWGSFSTHNPTGNTLYGADIAVHPDHQGKGVSKKLYAARRALVRRYNLKQTFPRGEEMHVMVNRLADLHPQYLEFFKDIATRHGLYIVAGSVPVRREDKHIYNVAHLFSPGGNVYTQDKLHITPAEARYWNIHPGDGLKVFDTPYGRIGILVCYDIEFPELSRLLVDAGVDIVIVPFATDERKSYQRVRYCAQARAVENMIYVVLSGNVGGLPRTPAMAVNFGQAAILTPSDFAFPFTAIAAEGALNTETVVVADVDLASLSIERQVSNVRPLIDRRKDIYQVTASLEVEHIRTH